MPWKEHRHIDRFSKLSSHYSLRYEGLEIAFEISCKWIHDDFKWILNCSTLGLYTNLLGTAGSITKEQCKQRSLQIIKQKLLDKIDEVDYLMNKINEEK